MRYYGEKKKAPGSGALVNGGRGGLVLQARAIAVRFSQVGLGSESEVIHLYFSRFGVSGTRGAILETATAPPVNSGLD
jgi:hypothetical protein